MSSSSTFASASTWTFCQGLQQVSSSDLSLDLFLWQERAVQGLQQAQGQTGRDVLLASQV